MSHRPLLVVAPLVAVLAACGAGKPDLRLHLQSGQNLLVVVEEVNERSDGERRWGDRVRIETERVVDAGGTFRVDPLRWTDRVVRVRFEETGLKETSWDSRSGEPPGDDPAVYAAMLGLTVRMDVPPVGDLKATFLDRRGVDRLVAAEPDLGGLFDSLFSESVLAANEQAALLLLPNHRKAVGERWTQTSPLAFKFDGHMRVEWTLERVEDGIATLSFSGEPVVAGGLPFDPKSMRVHGRVEHDTRAGLTRQVRQQVDIEMNDSLEATVIRTVTYTLR